METKNLQKLDGYLLEKLKSLSKINIQDNWLMMKWTILSLTDAKTAGISRAIIETINPQRNVTIDLAHNSIRDYGITQIFQTLAQYSFFDNVEKGFFR